MVEQQPSFVVTNHDQPFMTYPGMVTTAYGKKPTIKVPQNIICPDGRTQYASNDTCCINQSGGYSCCPYPNTICCPNRQYCCHLGYICNADGTCTQQHVICPDLSSCPLKNTCCPLPSGKYSCCPLPYASCCADGVHCCALGYSCKKDDTCTKTSIVCPNQKNICPLNNTCCPLNSGGYGCCAVLCLMPSAAPMRSVIYLDKFVTQMEHAQENLTHNLENNPP